MPDVARGHRFDALAQGSDGGTLRRCDRVTRGLRHARRVVRTVDVESTRPDRNAGRLPRRRRILRVAVRVRRSGGRRRFRQGAPRHPRPASDECGGRGSDGDGGSARLHPEVDRRLTTNQ